jgi:hypothetical protein
MLLSAALDGGGVVNVTVFEALAAVTLPETLPCA